MTKKEEKCSHQEKTAARCNSTKPMIKTEIPELSAAASKSECGCAQISSVHDQLSSEFQDINIFRF
jgi:hypothetical protein